MCSSFFKSTVTAGPANLVFASGRISWDMYAFAIQLFDGVGDGRYFDIAKSFNQGVARSLCHRPNSEAEDGENCGIDPSVHIRSFQDDTLSSGNRTRRGGEAFARVHLRPQDGG